MVLKQAIKIKPGVNRTSSASPCPFYSFNFFALKDPMCFCMQGISFYSLSLTPIVPPPCLMLTRPWVPLSSSPAFGRKQRRDNFLGERPQWTNWLQ